MDERLVVIGSLNMDLSVTVSRLPRPGETVSGADVVRGAGGKGANQAVAAARLGAGVRMVGLLGEDTLGGELRAGLLAEGVDAGGIAQLPGVSTGLALIVVQRDGENTITLSPGANHRLDVPALEELAEPAGPGETLLLQLEVPVETVLAAARSARAAGALTVLNAAPLPALPLPSELLAAVDVLVVNETEAAGLLAPGPEPDWATHARRLRALGPDTVVITLGAAGAVAAGPDGPVAEDGFPVAAVDTVGAGDAFCAQLALALGAGVPLAQAVRRSCAAGALATTRRGAQAALPTRAEVDGLLVRSGAGVAGRAR
ncbi:ribokinase [Streptomyces subrutilus]|uniref:Ribokinase n=1 Tax=Streptomyces subrutilus TaxID=36818 RepID=A0A5P2UW96_9ACTN|nr:ribokinase [Streptomyces subrutilus]QEU82515.1 ribokinase [Streptomyces subrutilus]WSJ28011.1 ribokinase [Streptomyces subrutilus]GGZ81752.1 ribokinase [Streptomyces subrutilus]